MLEEGVYTQKEDVMTNGSKSLLEYIKKSRDPQRLYSMLEGLAAERRDITRKLQEDRGQMSPKRLFLARRMARIIDQETSALKEFGRTELGMKFD